MTEEKDLKELTSKEGNCRYAESINPDKIRIEMPKLDPKERIKSFDEVEIGLTEEMAVKEALRCLGCEVELCIGCRICAEVCPDACISIETKQASSGKKYVTRYEVNSTICMFCGLCQEACPTKALVHSSEYELSVYKKEDMVYMLKN